MDNREKGKGKRIEQLDSVRGLASLTVVFHHLWMALPILPLVFSYSPARILVGGHAAVILFFILSGFVLSLPFLSNKQLPYMDYLIKRIFRIYLPYLVSIIIAILLSHYLYREGVSGFSEWFSKFWTSGLDFSLVTEHLMLVRNLHTDAYNTVVWSLIHEMRISIIFPLIMLLVMRYGLKINFLACIALTGAGFANDVFQLEQRNGHFTSFYDTVYFTAFFILGALLAKHRNELIQLYVGMNKITKWLLLGFALMLYTYSRIFEVVFEFPFSHIVTEYGIAAGTIIFIVMALGSAKVASLLMKKPVMFLGKISYSLYLYHFVILLSAIYLLSHLMPYWAICIVTLAASILISALSYYFIEKPSIKMGAALCGAMKRTDKTPDVVKA